MLNKGTNERNVMSVSFEKILQERASRFLMQHRSVPSKGSQSSPKASRDQLARELARHPGSSRSHVLDAIKAIAAIETGCRIATPEEEVRLRAWVRHNTGVTQTV